MEARSPREIIGSGGRLPLKADGRTPRLPKTPGPKQCRWCWAPVTAKRRLSWCGDACVDAYKEIAFPAAMARAILERDQNCCRICGVDVQKLREALWPRMPHFYGALEGWTDDQDALESTEREVEALNKHFGAIQDFRFAIRNRYRWFAKYPWARTMRHRKLYEIDHIVPVVEGGGGCGLDNLRLLCRGCHLEETKALAGRRARRPKKGYGQLKMQGG